LASMLGQDRSEQVKIAKPFKPQSKNRN